MNRTALIAAFNNPDFSVRFYLALRDVCIKKYSVQHVNNAKGVPCLAVRFVKNQLVFTDKHGQNIPRSLIFSILRSV